MVASDSWWLKLDRAQHHMEDIQLRVRRYSDSKPYRTSVVRRPPSQRHIWRYRLQFTEPPDPMIATVVGDFMHNIRSALDHVVVGFSKTSKDRQSASLPIATEDLWARNGKRFIVRDAERRKSFLRAITGLSPQAKTVVEIAQPYRSTDAVNHVFAIISRIDNADKHKQLILTPSTLDGASYVMRFRGRVVERRLTGDNQFLKDGAEFEPRIYRVIQPPLEQSEVDVELQGTATIALRVPGSGGNQGVANFPLDSTLRMCLESTRVFLREMEKTTRP